MGVSFIVSMLVMTRALELIPVATVLTAFRLAILLPIIASVVLWGEAVRALQILGTGLAIAALVLMTGRQFAGRGAARTASGALTGLLALAVFLLQGLGQICLRWVHYAGASEARLSVLTVTAATAGLLGALAVAAQRYRPNRADLTMGAGIGAYNLVCLAVILTALSRVPGTIFFPLHGCAVVILDNAFAHFYWRERLDRWTVAGAALGACAMLLVL
jgi:drug/metabolite transporter (DMT)-like permease